MSNSLAIAAVTRTLRTLITRAVQDTLPPNLPADVTPVNQIQVTTVPLDKVREVNANGNVLNIYLYSTVPNAALRNLNLPRDGAAVTGADPPLTLNLHYIVSAYGQDNNELISHLLLGQTMLALHDNALLMPADIGDSLAASGLQDQIERVRITPHPLNFEEMSKLWMAFETQYRISAAYEVAVVLIDSLRQRAVAPPVRAATIQVVPFSAPNIDSVNPQVTQPGSVLTIAGTNLGDPSVKVKIGTQVLSPQSASDRKLTVTLPANVRAGVNTLQVVQEYALGQPPVPHPGTGFESNVVAFVISPLITTAAPITVAHGATLQLSVTPPIGIDQRVTVLIGDRVIKAPAHAVSDPPTSNTAQFAVPSDFTPGSYLLRVQVDGASSPLTTDTNPQSATFNQYVAPMVAVT